jgi:hypothetical protein
MFRKVFPVYAVCELMCLNVLYIILCDSNGKQTQMWWEFGFGIKHGGKYKNHWVLK